MINPLDPGNPYDPNRADGLEARAQGAVDAAKRVTASGPSDLDRYYRRHDRWGWRKRFWLIGAGVVAFLAGVMLIGALTGDERTPRSAEALLALADKPLADPEAPVTALHVEQTLRQYYIGTGVEGRLAGELQRRTWYEAPNRQRIEEESTTYHLDGSVAGRDSNVYVWDGTSVWRYDAMAATVHVAAQDPDLDPWLSSLGGGLYLGRRGADPAQPTLRECSNPTADRPGHVADRLAHVFESNPLGCGLVLPGTDAWTRTWLDDATALLLRLETHDIHGTVGLAIDTTVFEVNGQLDPAKFAFAPPDGVSINDARPARFVDGVGTPQRVVPSIAEAQIAAGFPLRTNGGHPTGVYVRGRNGFPCRTRTARSGWERAIHVRGPIRRMDCGRAGRFAVLLPRDAGARCHPAGHHHGARHRGALGGGPAGPLASSGSPGR
jgi:outer membrane lipoprotein-sorting protein